MNGNDQSDNKQKNAPPHAQLAEPTTPLEIEPDEKQNAQKTAVREKRDRDESRILGFPTLDFFQTVFNGLLLASAIVGACFVSKQIDLTQEQIAAAQDAGIGQQRATNRALAIAENQAASSQLLADTMHSNERARLFVQNVFLTNTGMFPHVGEPVKAVVEIANSGRTVAKHVRGNLTLEILPTARTPKELPNQPFVGDYAIPPNAGGISVESDLELTENGKKVGPLLPEKLDLITKGRVALCVHGRVDYQDIFGSPHWITVCRIWKADTANVITGQRGGWEGCKQKQPSDDDEQSP